MTDVLVVGYGNDLRGDDAAGRHVVRRVAALGLPRVDTLEMHQLAPELADEVRRYATVVFVDAAAGGAGAVALRPVTPAPASQRSTHHATPAGVLDLAAAAYGSAPTGILVTIPAVGFDVGAPLSAEAERGVAEAVDAVVRLVAQSQ